MIAGLAGTAHAGRQTQATSSSSTRCRVVRRHECGRVATDTRIAFDRVLRGDTADGGRPWCGAAPSRRCDRDRVKAGRRGRGAMSSQPGWEDKRRPSRSPGGPLFPRRRAGVRGAPWPFAGGVTRRRFGGKSTRQIAPGTVRRRGVVGLAYADASQHEPLFVVHEMCEAWGVLLRRRGASRSSGHSAVNTADGGRPWCGAAPLRRCDRDRVKAGRRGRGAMSSQPGWEDERRPSRSPGGPLFPRRRAGVRGAPWPIAGGVTRRRWQGVNARNRSVYTDTTAMCGRLR